MSAQDLFSLSGRVALVTGGGRGLGLQIAEALADAGARVALASQSAEACREAVEALSARGAGAVGLPLDVRDSVASMCW